MPLIAVEVVLGFVVPVGWGVWELMSLRRERRRDADKAMRASLATGAVASQATTPSAPPSDSDTAAPGPSSS